MLGIVDTFVQLAPIVDFFLMLAIILLVLYFNSLLGSAYKRMGQVTTEAHAIFVTLLGEDMLRELEKTTLTMGEIGAILKRSAAVRDKLKEVAGAQTEAKK